VNQITLFDPAKVSAFVGRSKLNGSAFVEVSEKAPIGAHWLEAYAIFCGTPHWAEFFYRATGLHTVPATGSEKFQSSSRTLR
jgi:hypothetical protein